MAGLPDRTLYHRWLGWHAPALRQGLLALGVGLVAGVVLQGFQPWQVAIVEGWDVASLILLVAVWPMILRADPAATRELAQREDPGRIAARVILLGACLASLVGIGAVLALAGRGGNDRRLVLICVAVATVVVSWTVVNTVYVLRYAQLRIGQSDDGITFPDDATQQAPRFRDFVYVAFTIGMTYQVSDTVVRDPRNRTVVLCHALLSYLFGVVIVAGTINLVAGLVR
jgi:uncharacterized membrane protein